MADVINLEGVIERQKVGGFLLLTLAMGTVVQLIEGFDLVAAGVAGPALAKSLHIDPAYLGFIFSSFFFGLVIGALVFGLLGDVIGRKSTTIISTLWYGVFSIATISVTSMGPLVVLRFLTGLGLGGVLPTTIALMCEYAPSRMRATVVNVMLCGLNVGGAIGGFSGAKFIPIYGWHFIFYVGGIVPILLVPMFMLWLPESARFLVLRGKPRERIAAIVRKIDPRLRIAADTGFATRDVQLKGVPVRHLFAKGWAVATILLWITMVLNQILIGFFTQYMPAMLNTYGLDMANAVRAAGVFQLGAVIGTLALGFIIDRCGYFIVLATVYFGAFACSFLIVSFGVAVAPILIVAFFAGICVAGGQNTANALAGVFYPTLARSTGAGWGLGIGRLGVVIGIPLSGLLLRIGWTVPMIFMLIGVAGFCAGISILLMRRQAARSPEIRSARAFEGAEPLASGASS